MALKRVVFKQFAICPIFIVLGRKVGALKIIDFILCLLFNQAGK